MPRETGLDFGDVEVWIKNIQSEVAQNAAEAVIRQLQIKGPYWTGAFAGAWEARVGNTTIPADLSSPYRGPDRSALKQPRQLETYSVQQAPKKPGKTLWYTIDNRMEYREIAKDLIPDGTGMFRGDKPGKTAPKNWYRTYLESGGLKTTLALATNRTASDPRIKNFKGNLNK